jgi:hypothetical protein
MQFSAPCSAQNRLDHNATHRTLTLHTTIAYYVRQQVMQASLYPSTTAKHSITVHATQATAGLTHRLVTRLSTSQPELRNGLFQTKHMKHQPVRHVRGPWLQWRACEAERTKALTVHNIAHARRLEHIHNPPAVLSSIPHPKMCRGCVWLQLMANKTSTLQTAAWYTSAPVRICCRTEHNCHLLPPSC